MGYGHVASWNQNWITLIESSYITVGYIDHVSWTLQTISRGGNRWNFMGIWWVGPWFDWKSEQPHIEPWWQTLFHIWLQWYRLAEQALSAVENIFYRNSEQLYRLQLFQASCPDNCFGIELCSSYSMPRIVFGVVLFGRPGHMFFAVLFAWHPVKTISGK